MVVNIDPWLQEILYGALSIFAITVFPEGVVGLLRSAAWPPCSRPPPPRRRARRALTSAASQSPRTAGAGAAIRRAAAEAIVECRGIDFGYGQGPKVLRKVDLAVKRGHIHGLIGPNGSGKSTLANIIAGRLRPLAGTTHVKGVLVDGLAPSARAGWGCAGPSRPPSWCAS